MDAVERIISLIDDIEDAVVNKKPDIIIDKEDIEKLCELAKNQLTKSTNILHVNGSTVIVGDIHGNIKDLLSIFKLFGTPEETKFLFLGDYVDRGKYSIYVITVLLAILVKFPESAYMIRGNHEFATINRYYGFYDEIITTYGDDSLWVLFNDVFNNLPLCAILNERVFCVHGGLSPYLHSLSAIEAIRKPLETYLESEIVTDMVWSDPIDTTQEGTFTENRRGLGVKYTTESIISFLSENCFSILVRAHQCVMNGVNIFAENNALTVFSSSEYSPNLHNKSGVVVIKEKGSVQLFSLDFTKPLSKQETITFYLNSGAIGLFAEKEKTTKETRTKRRKRSRSESPKHVSGCKAKKKNSAAKEVVPAPAVPCKIKVRPRIKMSRKTIKSESVDVTRQVELDHSKSYENFDSLHKAKHVDTMHSKGVVSCKSAPKLSKSEKHVKSKRSSHVLPKQSDKEGGTSLFEDALKNCSKSAK